MGRIDPVTDALLTLYETNAASQKARIDYETAEARRTQIGRSAVPGVMAQLKERELKRQKQQESIAKAGQSGQPSVQSMLPPTTDVSGQTSGRDMSGSLKAVAEIAGQFISPGGPQPAAVKPGAIQGIFGQAGVGQGINPAAPSPGQPPQPGPSPPAPPPGQGPQQPGSIVQSQVPASRGMGALELVLGMATRSGQMMLEGGKQLVTGETTVAQQVPTLEQIGGAYGNDLAELELLRQNATDPKVQAAAENLYKQRLEEIRSRYGDEAVDFSTKEMTTTVLQRNRTRQEKLEAEERAFTKSKQLSGFRADLNAQNQRDLAAFSSGLRTAEEIATEQRARTTPEGMLKEQQAQIGLKYLESGEKSLSEPELSALPPDTQRRIALKQAPKISPTTAANLEGMSNTARDYQQLARELKAHWNPGYFSTGASIFAEGFKQRSRAAEAGITMAALSEEDQKWLDDYTAMDKAVRSMKADVVRSKAGAAATPLELKLYEPIIPGPDDSKETASVKLDQFIEYQGMTALRADLARSVGYDIESAKTNWPFADMRKMVSAFEDSAVIKLQEQNPGMDPSEALRQVDELIMDKYGLDPNKYAVP